MLRSTGGSEFTVDGIVELWFTSAEVALAGIGSEVSERLVADEPRFLSGLTGAPVDAPGPAALTGFGLWFLGWTPDGSRVSRRELEAIEQALSEVPGAGRVTVNTLEPNGSLLVRNGLQQMPALPACAVSVGFAGRGAVQQAEQRLEQDLAGLAAAFARVQLLTTEVVSIIEPAGGSGAAGGTPNGGRP